MSKNKRITTVQRVPHEGQKDIAEGNIIVAPVEGNPGTMIPEPSRSERPPEKPGTTNTETVANGPANSSKPTEGSGNK